MNSILVNSDDLDSITSVDVSFSNRVDDIFGSVLNFLLGLGQHFHLVVVANELVVQNRGTELGTRSLDTIGQLIVRTNSIITEDAANTVLIKSAKQVEGIERHESSAIERIRQELGNRFHTGLFLVLHHIDLDSCDQVSVESLNISDHTGTSEHAGRSQLCSLGVRSAQDVISSTDTGVSGHSHEVRTSDGYNKSQC